jgi:hypothetical protein
MTKITVILALLAIGAYGCNRNTDNLGTQTPESQQRMEDTRGQMNSGSMGGDTPNANDYQQGQQQNQPVNSGEQAP